MDIKRSWSIRGCVIRKGPTDGTTGYQPQGGRIDEQLKTRVGVTEEIDIIFFTHLHWDHCSNMKLFTRAKFYLQKRELEFALHPSLPPYYRSYEASVLGLKAPYEGCSFDLIEGEFRYNENITLFPTQAIPSAQSSPSDGERWSSSQAMPYSSREYGGDPKESLEFIPSGIINYFDM
jgi:hypothetical protein